MRQRSSGRILITGSIAGFMPGTFQAVYNGTKALLDSFAVALRAELRDSGVSVTCLMPGPTETLFFARSGQLDTRYAAEEKQPADEVAREGFDAMQRGDADAVTGLVNKLRVAMSHVIPDETLAEMHRKKAEPGSAYEG
jgi:short-subunit dehydrogenase